MPSPLVRRIASVEGREARLGLWAEAIGRSPPAEAARELHRLVLDAARRDVEALAAYLPLLDVGRLASRAGPGRLGDVLAEAQREELSGCLLLLENPGGAAPAAGLGPPPDPALEALTLGHRKAAARGLRGPLLDRLLRDPDPRVVGEVLRNPRLRESEVLAIASRRPCPAEVFFLLVASETWVRRPAVRRALVLNPYAPPRLAVALLPTLGGQDLLAIAGEAANHAAVREWAVTVAAWSAGEGE